MSQEASIRQLETREDDYIEEDFEEDNDESEE